MRREIEKATSKGVSVDFKEKAVGGGRGRS